MPSVSRSAYFGSYILDRSALSKKFRAWEDSAWAYNLLTPFFVYNILFVLSSIEYSGDWTCLLGFGVYTFQFGIGA